MSTKEATKEALKLLLKAHLHIRRGEYLAALDILDELILSITSLKLRLPSAGDGDE